MTYLVADPIKPSKRARSSGFVVVAASSLKKRLHKSTQHIRTLSARRCVCVPCVQISTHGYRLNRFEQRTPQHEAPICCANLCILCAYTCEPKLSCVRGVNKKQLMISICSRCIICRICEHDTQPHAQFRKLNSTNNTRYLFSSVCVVLQSQDIIIRNNYVCHSECKHAHTHTLCR